MTRVVVLLLIVLLSPVRRARAEEAVDQESWGRLLAAYFRNPSRVRGALIRAAGAGVATLPIPVVLAVADAEMRREHYEAARELCAAVLARHPDEPWSGWATLADAWAAIQLGHEDEAAAAMRPLADGGGPSNMLGAFLLALLDGGRGAFDAAEAGFERVHESGASEELRIASLLGMGLSRYWAGDYEAAGGTFRYLDAEHAASPLADDARYGSALSELGLGHRGEALRLLREMTRDDRKASAIRGNPDLVDLAPRAVVQAAFDRYRRSSARAPEAQVATALDADAHGLARAMLARLSAEDRGAASGASDAPHPTEVDRRGMAPAEPSGPGLDRATDGSLRPNPAALAHAPGADGSGLWWVAVVGAFLLGGAATFWRRRPSDMRRSR